MIGDQFRDDGDVVTVLRREWNRSGSLTLHCEEYERSMFRKPHQCPHCNAEAGHGTPCLADWQAYKEWLRMYYQSLEETHKQK